MKFKIFIVIFFIAFRFNAISQSIEAGQAMASVGYGLGSYRALFFDAFNTSASSSMLSNETTSSSLLGPVYLRIEYMVNDDVSFGGNFALVKYNLNSTYSTKRNGNDTTVTDKYSFLSYSILGRINYHFNPEDNFDFYTGLAFGYRYADNKVTDGFTGKTTKQNEFNIPLGFEAIIGARYLITENFGLYSEVGIAKSVLQFGATYKF
jgi:hypothetical protein